MRIQRPRRDVGSLLFDERALSAEISARSLPRLKRISKSLFFSGYSFCAFFWGPRFSSTLRLRIGPPFLTLALLFERVELSLERFELRAEGALSVELAFSILLGFDTLELAADRVDLVETLDRLQKRFSLY